MVQKKLEIVFALPDNEKAEQILSLAFFGKNQKILQIPLILESEWSRLISDP